MERVVVTGLGVISCIGTDVPAFWRSLTEGKSGIATIASFDASNLSARIAGEVRDYSFDRKLGKRMDRFTQFALSDE